MSHRHNEMHMEIFVNGYFCGGGREWLGRSVREKNFGGGVGGKGGVETVSFLIRLIHKVMK